MEFVFVGGGKPLKEGTKHVSNDIQVNENNPFQTCLKTTSGIQNRKKTDYNKFR
jgi:hypothetical protein